MVAAPGSQIGGPSGIAQSYRHDPALPPSAVTSPVPRPPTLGAVDPGAAADPPGPDGDGQARGHARNARGEPPVL